MDPRTQMFLSAMLWGIDVRGPGPLRSFGDTFELWAGRHGLPRSVEELEERQLIETATTPELGRLVRLARAGIIAALGGRDPIARWERPWDGRWRTIAFDVPLNRGALRARVRRRLKAAHFGCLQRSVWISPDPVPLIRDHLGTAGMDPKSLIVLEARPVAGEVDRDLVRAAWNFRRINLLYERYLRRIEEPPPRGEALRHWREKENHLWLAAVGADPLLPLDLHPRGYLGPRAFERRRALLRS
ncbi:MAG TPA: hypothetical protein VEB66_05645 [Opitutaceae bacterium]|nr:hypothetical protein [Opitutaceae bacterium]